MLYNGRGMLQKDCNGYFLKLLETTIIIFNVFEM